MTRSKIVLLNKVNRVLRVLLDRSNSVIVKVEGYNAYITLQGINYIHYTLAKELAELSKKYNVKWNITIKDNNAIINIWT